MKGQFNPKIVGATIVGFALVAGAYTVGNFGKPRQNSQPASVNSSASTERVAIGVSDSDNNGIEDWRDEFITTAAVKLDKTSTPYTPPDTLTGQMSIDFMEGIIRSRGYGAFGSSDDEVIGNTVESLSRETEQKLYDTSDIIIMGEWDDQDIINYANTAAATIYRHSIPNMESELLILRDYLNTHDEKRMNELKSLVAVYKGYRDDTLKIPVPALLAKEHLDLINTYEAIYTDIKAMTLAVSDPTVALLRLKRYQDDATGLAYAMQNMYLALEPKADLFKAEDPAILFAIFSPNYKTQ